MKFLLASVLAVAASAAAPPASVEQKTTGLSISTSSENLGDGFHLFHLKKEDVDEATRKRRANRKLNGKGKGTSAPTEAPKFFFDVDGLGGGEPFIMTEISGNFVSGKPSDCLGDACQGDANAIIDGAFDGCGNGSVSVAYACTLGVESFYLACPGVGIEAAAFQSTVDPNLVVSVTGPTVSVTCTAATVGELTIECEGIQDGTDCCIAPYCY